MKRKRKLRKPKKLNGKIKKILTETQVGALMEHFDNGIQIIAESQIDTNEKLGKLRGEFYDSRSESKSFREETRDNFKLVFEHFSNIEDELNDIKSKLDKIEKDKIDKKEFYSLKIRVEKLEKKLEKIKSEAKC